MGQNYKSKMYGVPDTELGGRQWSGFVGVGLVEVRDELRSVREFGCW